ncbi:MAG TPA: hypothetical protein VJ375_01215 [Gaiellaceae bacterium]|jgi:hypothetical protein|nr:hypothetical protein [Gaiellaceae bacterium]
MDLGKFFARRRAVFLGPAVVELALAVALTADGEGATGALLVLAAVLTMFTWWSLNGRSLRR